MSLVRNSLAGLDKRALRHRENLPRGLRAGWVLQGELAPLALALTLATQVSCWTERCRASSRNLSRQSVTVTF